MSHKLILLAAVAAAVSGGVVAQSTAVLGPRNAAFMEGLWRVGYLDYAERIGEMVATSNLPEAEKAAVASVHTKLKIAKAAQSGDALMRRDLVLKVLEDKKAKLATAEVGSDAHVDLMGEIVEQCRLYADAVAEALAQEKPPEELATIRKDAEAVLTAVFNDLKERKDAYAKLRDEEKPGSELPMLVAFYGLGRIAYYTSLVLPAGTHQSNRKAEEALTILEEFDLEFSDSLAAFEAKLTYALAHQRLGDVEAALADCDDAISLRERYGDKAKNGQYPVDKAGADVISAAVVQKCLILKDKEDFAKIVETTTDFFTSIPGAIDALQGPAVLAAQAEAHMKLGDNEAAQAEAQRLVEIDPKGRWGYRGKELLAELISTKPGGVSADRTLDLALSLAEQGNYDESLRLCRQAILAAPADEAGQNVAAKAMLTTGAIFATREWFHEASVAFDAVVRRYPKSTSAPDALWRSVNCFFELQSEQGEKNKFFKAKADERSKQLVRDYPDDPKVGQLQLVDGRALEKAGKFLEAAAVYEKIAADSSVYLDARYYAASCYQRHARKLDSGGQKAEADKFTAKAREGFVSVLQSVENDRITSPGGGDPKKKAAREVIEFGTRIALASLLLGDNKPAEADKVMAEVKLKDDDKQMPVVWALQIRSRLVQGQAEQAADAMDAALAKAPDAKPLLAVCRPLATAFDNQAVERNKKKETTTATTLWKRALGYYMKGASGATPAEVAQIADRLMIIGMVIQNIDEKVDGWYETLGREVQSADAWEAALDLYARLGEDANYKARVSRARILGFMGRYNEAEAELAQVFAKENILGPNKRLDNQAIGRKPELLTAYLEYGFAMRGATGGDEKSRRAKASDVFDRVGLSVPPDGKHWWFARYGQIQTLVDRGLYDIADVSLSSLIRTNPDLDGDRFGLKTKFRALELAIAAKVPKKK